MPGQRVPLGFDRLGTEGVFRFDPFELYGSGVVTNALVWAGAALAAFLTGS